MISKYEELKNLFKQLFLVESEIAKEGEENSTIFKKEKADVEAEINTIIGTVDINKIKIGAYTEVIKDLEYQKKFISELENQEKTVQMSINRIRNRVNRLKNFNHKINKNEPASEYQPDSDEVNGNRI